MSFDNLGGDFFTVNREVVGVENVDFALCKFRSHFDDFFNGAFCCRFAADVGEHDAAGFQSAGPVGFNCFALCGLSDDVFEVRCPIDSGRNDEGVGASLKSAAVVRHVGDACSFACGRCTHGVCVLADELAAAFDECFCSFFFCSKVIPRTRELDVHRHAGANGFCTEEERSVTGNNFCISECADIAHFCLFCGDGAVCNHFVEFETCCNACKVSAFIDGCKCIVEVCKFACFCVDAGCVAELNVGVLFCNFFQELLMAKGVCKDNVATCFNEFFCCCFTFCIFGDVGFEDKVCFGAEAKLLNSFFCSVDEVLVISGRVIVQADDTDLEIIFDFDF